MSAAQMFICCQHVNRILSSRRHTWILASQYFYLLVDPKSCPNWFPLNISAPFLNFSLMALLSPGHSHCGCKAVPQVVAVAIKGGRVAGWQGSHHPPIPHICHFFYTSKIYTEKTRKLRQNTQKIANILRYYVKIHSKLPIFCVITAKYTVNCQFFALNQ